MPDKKLTYNIFLFFTAIVTYYLFFFIFLNNNPCLFLYDAGHYHEAAQGILHHGAYLGYKGNPLFYRLPGYPAFLSILYWINNEWILGTLLLQIILAATLPLLIRKIIYQLTRSTQLALLTSVLSTIAPGYLIFAGMLLTEILFTWLFFVFLIFVLKIIENPSLSLSFIAGLILGMLTLIRPVGHLLLPFLIIYLIFFIKTSWPKKIIACSALLFGWLIPAGSWLLRNFLLTGHLFFHTLSGPHFINHVAIRLLATKENISYKAAQKNMYIKLESKKNAAQKEKNRILQEIEITKLYEQEVLKAITLCPINFLKLASINCLKTTLGLYSSELLVIDANGALPSYDRIGFIPSIKRYLLPSVHNKLILLIIYLEILLLLLSIIGAIFAGIRYRKNILTPESILIIGCIFFFIGISFACGYARLRMTIEIFYLLAAANGIKEIKNLLCSSV